jgi:hypothetical protein
MIRSRVSALAVILVLAASCSGKADSSQDTSVKTSTRGLRINILIRGNHVYPPSAVHKVDRGKQVGISVISNVVDEMDIHGYNKVLGLAPGQGTQLIIFTTDKKGLFPVELRQSHLRLLQIHVT